MFSQGMTFSFLVSRYSGWFFNVLGIKESSSWLLWLLWWTTVLFWLITRILNISYLIVRSIILLVQILISGKTETKNIRIVCSSIKIFLIIAMVWRKCGGFIAGESTFLHTNWTSYIELLLEHTTLIFSQGTYNFCFVFKFIIFYHFS